MKKLLKSKNDKIVAVISVIIIIIGICIALRPWYIAWRFDRMQKSLLDAWNNTSEFHEDTSQAGWRHSVAVVGGDADNDIWEEDTNPHVDMNYIINNMDGILTIAKINLSVPIINKYTIDNLNVSICSVIETRKMGQEGNYVLAGHKSRIRGRHFSRLLELKTGDIIVTENKEVKYTYLVKDVFTVTPLDLWVMDNDGDKKLITLITCDYRTDPIGRLIVRGELINSELLL